MIYNKDSRYALIHSCCIDFHLWSSKICLKHRLTLGIWEYKMPQIKLRNDQLGQDRWSRMAKPSGNFPWILRSSSTKLGRLSSSKPRHNCKTSFHNLGFRSCYICCHVTIAVILQNPKIVWKRVVGRLNEDCCHNQSRARGEGRTTCQPAWLPKTHTFHTPVEH
jgi:hypothetical protein